MNSYDGCIQDVTERLDLGLDPENSQSKRLCFLAQRIECPQKTFGCLSGDKRVIHKIKISDPRMSEQPDFSDILPSTWSMQVLSCVGASTQP